MRRKTVFGLVLGVSALLAVGGLFASNMGFKLNYPLVAQLMGVSLDGTQTLALPYNQQTDLVDAFDLIQDIGGTDVVAKVTRFDPKENGLVPYEGTIGAPFALVPGQAYQIQIKTDTNYIIVGSHDPGLVINLKAQGADSLDGTNFYAYPYHSVAADADDLITEINAAAGSNVVVKVTQFDPVENGLVPYEGTVGSPFALVPGQGYQVQVTQNVSFVPAHY